jgi:hypothetical protein
MRAIACALIVTLPLLSFLPAAEPAGEATGRIAALAPYIGEETFALVRFDATKLDADAFVNHVKSIVPDAEERFGDAAGTLKKRLASFTSAGGTEVIVAFSTADLPWISLIVVPLKDGADEAALKQM